MAKPYVEFDESLLYATIIKLFEGIKSNSILVSNESNVGTVTKVQSRSSFIYKSYHVSYFSRLANPMMYCDQQELLDDVSAALADLNDDQLDLDPFTSATLMTPTIYSLESLRIIMMKVEKDALLQAKEIYSFKR